MTDNEMQGGGRQEDSRTCLAYRPSEAEEEEIEVSSQMIRVVSFVVCRTFILLATVKVAVTPIACYAVVRPSVCRRERGRRAYRGT